jgi:TolB-like protein
MAARARTPRAVGLGAGGLLAMLLLATAGAPPVRHSVGGALPDDHARVALLPFDNLAGREEESQVFTRVFFGQLVASGAFELVDPVRVDAAMDSLGLLSALAVTPASQRQLADTLGARYLLLGSVLESGTVQTGDGPVPAAGATLRLVDPASGRVLWAGVHFRSGEDRESIFGWGRIRSKERLILELASDMLRDFRETGARRAQSRKTGGTR